MSSATLTLDEFKRLKADLHSARSARVRVGVLGNRADRFDEDWNKEKLNNPSLGLVHEFGSKTKNIPARSFLRMPLMTRLPKRLDQIGRAFWRAMILKTGVHTALKALGVEGETVVQEAFETGGFGTWPAWSKRYAAWRRRHELRLRAKGSTGPITGGGLLILSHQLRRSITSRVEKGRAKP